MLMMVVAPHRMLGRLRLHTGSISITLSLVVSVRKCLAAGLGTSLVHLQHVVLRIR